MPHDEWGNYYEYRLKQSVINGLVLTVVVAFILSIPGWIAAAIWGWSYFFRGAGTFWIVVLIVLFVIDALYFVFGPDD
jgi:sterol desaturase/sphingolipid hydroxylase (fatty acid hydroxylase superfamily)